MILCLDLFKDGICLDCHNLNKVIIWLRYCCHICNKIIAIGFMNYILKYLIPWIKILLLLYWLFYTNYYIVLFWLINFGPRLIVVVVLVDLLILLFEEGKNLRWRIHLNGSHGINKSCRIWTNMNRFIRRMDCLNEPIIDRAFVDEPGGRTQGGRT